jgi:hypothetical protein
LFSHNPVVLLHGGLTDSRDFAGNPARAGHSVEVLLRVYAKCIDGQAATVTIGSTPRCPSGPKIIPRISRELSQSAAYRGARLHWR